eukprot:scaffold2111_cov130-Isochrysis_galbana.AAC.3
MRDPAVNKRRNCLYIKRLGTASGVGGAMRCPVARPYFHLCIDSLPSYALPALESTCHLGASLSLQQPNSHHRARRCRPGPHLAYAMVPLPAARRPPVCAEDCNFARGAPREIVLRAGISGGHRSRVRHVERPAPEVDPRPAEQQVGLVWVRRLVLMGPVDSVLAVARGKHFPAELPAPSPGLQGIRQSLIQRRNDGGGARQTHAGVGAAAPAPAALP